MIFLSHIQNISRHQSSASDENHKNSNSLATGMTQCVAVRPLEARRLDIQGLLGDGVKQWINMVCAVVTLFFFTVICGVLIYLEWIAA